MQTKIELTQGYSATVDAEDYDELAKHKWYAAVYRKRRIVYAVRHEEGKMIFMHRQIMNAPKGMLVDHRNGDGLMNVRSNLRLATHANNGQNRRLDSRNSSGCSGVWFDKGRQLWKSEICVAGKKVFLGWFQTFDGAVYARKQAEKEHYGEFAREGLIKGPEEKPIEVKSHKDRKVAKNSVSGVNGVSWNERKQCWQASLYSNGKRHHLGWHKTLETAVAARKEAEQKYYGQQATT